MNVASTPTDIVSAFRAQVAARPDAPAASHRGRTWTYRQLDARANRIARWIELRETERRRDDAPASGSVRRSLVPFCGQRGLDQIAVQLAVLELGAAYVPLDARTPRERMRFLIEDTRADVLLTDATSRRDLAAVVAGLGRPVRLLDLDADAELIDAQPGDARDARVGPLDVCYVMYTSGSTGRPKGVVIRHEGVTRLVLGANYLDVGPRDVFVQGATLAFDAATFEIWGALLNGARIALVDPDDMVDPRRFRRFLAEEGATVLFLTTALFNQHVRADPTMFHGLRHLMFGGEAASIAAVQALWDGGARPPCLHNVYGPTENTVFSTFYPIVRRPEDGASLPIGRAVSGTTCHVATADLEEAPRGAVGELLLAGAGLAREYLHRPDLTAEKFVTPAFGGGARMYRSGDLVREMPSGDLVFVGRVDNQVKVRGFRVEPGEIELVLRRHPGLVGAEVLAEDDVTGSKRLAAFVLAAGDARPSASALRALVEAELPSYMVPSVFRRVDRLPLTSTGKVDRQALPGCVVETLSDAGEKRPPRDALEADIRDVWARHLGADPEEIGVDAEFFSLGGQSLVAAAIVTELSERRGVDLRMGDLFRAPTVAALAEHVRGLAPRALLPIPRLDDDATIPLSFSQEQVWLHQQAAPSSVHYNEPLDVTIPEAIDVDALERALDHVVARHEALRLRLDQGGARPVQRIADPIPARLSYADLRHLPQGRAAAHAQRLATDQAARPFDLAREPPLRCLLVRFEQALFRLYLAGHHVALDGVSMFRVFLPELREAYRAVVKGEEPRLPPLPHRYRDLVAAQRSRAGADAWAPELAYWAGRLAGLAPLDLPGDRPRGPETSFAGARVVLALPADLTSRVRSLARRAGASTFHVLFAAFQTLLRRYVGQDDIAVASVVAGRDLPGLDRHVGDFLNTLILRTNVPVDARFLDVLGRAKATCEEAIAHQDAPFQLVVHHARLGTGRPGDAPVQVAFVLEPEGPPDAGGWEMNQLEIHTGTSKFDLTMELDERGGRVIGRVEYRTDLFDRATIERLIGHYERLLEGIVREPEARIDDLPLLRDDERELVVRAWNDTAVSLDGPRLLHAFVERAARRWPDAPAIADARGVLDFATLDRASNRLAHRLVALGARRDDRIAVWTERTGAHVVAQVAILKAGAAFVPLTPAEPIARARTILEDAGVRIVVHDDAHASALEGTDLVAVSVEPGAHVDQPDTPPDVAIHPDDLAYVIYTSGSTGKPKGAAITHGAVAARTEWEAHQLAMRPGDFALHLSAYGFDGAFTATFWSFAAGAGAVIPSRAEIQDAGALVALCRRFRVTGAFTTPALWKLLVEPFAAAGVRLAWAMAGGERVTGELIDRLKAVASRVFNVYGPTEATIMATGWEAPLGEAAASRADPPIGAPIGNVTTYILDERLRPVPIGVPGELFIGGPTIGRGYLGRPDLDARAFIADPFDPTGRGRLYRTGDRCRWLPTGDIDFLGRLDAQVKLRGYRIELGEIEAALEADARVDACAVVLRADGGQPRLVAYVAGPGAGDVAGLRERLAAELPGYMIPAAIVPLPTLPLTSNGKVDRRALPAPTADRQGSERRVAAPRTDLERSVLRRFRAVLQDEGVGIDDDFFAVGGDSLRAMEMVARAAEEGLALTMRDVLRYRTVAAIAGAMRGREDADPSAPRAAREPASPATERRTNGRALASASALRSGDGLVPLREGGASPPFFCVHPAGGSATCYRALAEHLPGRDFYGLECVESYREETVESLAAGHLARAREVQPVGPYLFGGWSFGGVVAFEMARQVEAAGGRVGLVALLDSRPTTHAHQLRFLRHMNDDSAAILALIGRHLATMAGRANPFDYATLRALPEAQRRPWFLAELARAALVPAALVDGFAARFVDDFARCHAILRAYRPAALCETDLLLLRATAISDPYPGFPAMEVPVEEDPDLTYGWKDLTKGQTTVKTVGATHETIVFAPHVRRVGALLADALRDALREPPTFVRAIETRTPRIAGGASLDP